MHDQKAVASALEVHLPIGKAMRRTRGNRQILFPSAVKPRRIKRRPAATLGAGDIHQLLIGEQIGLIAIARGLGTQHRGGNALFPGDGRIHLPALLLVELRDGLVDAPEHRRRALRVVDCPVRRDFDQDVLMLQRGMQVHLLVARAQTRPAEDELRVHRRLKRHRGLIERGVPAQDGEIVPAPGDQLRILPAPGRKIRKDVRKRSAVFQLRLGHAGDLFDVLIQLFIKARADQRAEGVDDSIFPVHAACADFDDLMRHAVVRVVAALIPFQIEYDDMAAIAAGKRKHGSHPVPDSCPVRVCVFFSPIVQHAHCFS